MIRSGGGTRTLNPVALKSIATRSAVADRRGDARGQPAAERSRSAPAADRRWLAATLITLSAGVATAAVAFAGARRGSPWADAVLWTALLIIVLPVAVRLLGTGATRGERLWLVSVLGLALYAVFVLEYPNAFVLHDELGHVRSVADILRTGRLYTTNPVDPAYSAYPGILSLTAALARLSGLGITPAGLIVVAVAKLLVMGGLFLFVERVLSSSRAAGIAVLLYTANPNFVFFDSQFAYESLAVGIAAVALWMVARAADEEHGGWRDVMVAVVLDAALVLTHHLTSYAVALVVAVWAVLSLLRRGRGPTTWRLVTLAATVLAVTLVYAIVNFAATQSDIGGSIVSSFRGLYDVVAGSSKSKAPFSAAAGYTDPPLEKVTGLVAVALLLAAWPFGLYAAWRRRRIGPGVVILGLAALLYPASLALRLTAAGSETSNRTSEFVFAGLGGVIALALIMLLGRWFDNGGWRERGLRLLAVAYVGVVFAGGITVGTPPYQTLPAGYEVAADNRSVDSEGVDAARWAARWLAPNQDFLADENGSVLFTGYTRLNAQAGSAAGVPVGQLFVSSTFGAAERRIIGFDKLRYLVVDRRDSTALPRSGHYFDGGDPEKYSSPIAAHSLQKFSSVPCLDRVFVSGNVTIYDAQSLLRGGCR
jgi:hypothetical protein